jgi:hypothetical protein
MGKDIPFEYWEREWNYQQEQLAFIKTQGKHKPVYITDDICSGFCDFYRAVNVNNEDWINDCGECPFKDSTLKCDGGEEYTELLERLELDYYPKRDPENWQRAHKTITKLVNRLRRIGIRLGYIKRINHG